MTPYLTLGLTLGILGLIGAGALVLSRAHYLAKIAISSLMVAVSIYTWVKVGDLIGLPVHRIPPDGSAVISLLMDEDGNSIYFWIKEKPEPRMYVVPYSEELARKLIKAMTEEAEDGGGILILHLNRDKDHKNHTRGHGFFKDDSDWDIDVEIQPSMPPKN